MCNGFGVWDESINSIPDQEKRIKSAQLSATTPSDVDKENRTGTFSGSGKNPYVTTLDTCTCGDFLRRGLPCKHIYRLAMECGLIPFGFSTGINKNVEKTRQMKLKDAVAFLELLSLNDQELVRQMLYYSLYGNGTERVVVKYGDEPDCFLIQSEEMQTMDTLSNMKKAQLSDILKSAHVVFPKSANKNTLIDLCKENATETDPLIPKYSTLKFVPEFKSSQRKLYTYILRKFDWDEYYNENMEIVKYPHGAIQQPFVFTIGAIGTAERAETNTGNMAYTFPDDEVTKLLTQYGHNRCLNGYSEVNEDFGK